MSSLVHKTVVILGGTSGIGLATAKAAQAEGARVVVTGRSHDRLQAAQSELGSGALIRARCRRRSRYARARFQELDRVDHIFITAGIVALDARLTPDSASLRPAMDIRFWGAFNAAKYGAADMNARADRSRSCRDGAPAAAWSGNRDRVMWRGRGLRAFTRD
jgi:NADP-dependent 3-hydroxy acid dehydrogenase YdfG